MRFRLLKVFLQNLYCLNKENKHLISNMLCFLCLAFSIKSALDFSLKICDNVKKSFCKIEASFSTFLKFVFDFLY